MLLIAFAALLLPQQATTCTTSGNTTRCEPDAGVALRDWLVRAPAGQQQQEASIDAAKDRRAAAYAQVGKLIADGRCEDAKRLASFYGQPDIVKDTNRACAK